MAASFLSIFRTSVFRKQMVAVTGLLMVLFILAHLAGNMLIYLGPEALNDYSEKLHAIPELLWIARIGLVTALVLHVFFTVQLVFENASARGSTRYAVSESKREDLAFGRRTMAITGSLVFVYIFIHLADFTIADKSAENAATFVNGEPQALYGLVWNSFQDAWRVGLYVVAVCCVGLHLSHGIQSLFQTVGFFHDKYTPAIRRASVALGVIVAVGFSSIPVYVFMTGAPETAEAAIAAPSETDTVSHELHEHGDHQQEAH